MTVRIGSKLRLSGPFALIAMLIYLAAVVSPALGASATSGTVFGICTTATSCRAGSAGGLGGEMNLPHAVATSAAGNVYVADADNNRIQSFDSAGNFELTWGRGVNATTGGNLCTAASGDTCQAGSIGGLGGEFSSPSGVATSAAGNVYVADADNNRIQRFDSAGTFELMWGKSVNATTGGNLCTAASGDTCQAGSVGALGGEMNGANAVATDASGNVYVVDAENNRIQKFDSAGTFERAWGKDVNGGGVFGTCTTAPSCQAGSVGGLGGEMNLPHSLAIGVGGNVYVVDADNNRIQRFDSAGIFELMWGKGVNATTSGNLCTAVSGDTCQAGAVGGLGGEMNGPRGVAIGAGGKVYVADYFNDRIQRFDTAGNFELTWGRGVNATTSGNLCTAVSSDTCEAGTGGELGGEMTGPHAVGTDAGGNVYVADYFNYRIQKFDSAGSFERTWGKGVNAPGTTQPSTSTGQPSTGTGERAVAIKKCKKKYKGKAKTKKRKKCIKKAKKLPL